MALFRRVLQHSKANARRLAYRANSNLIETKSGVLNVRVPYSMTVLRRFTSGLPLRCSLPPVKNPSEIKDISKLQADVEHVMKEQLKCNERIESLTKRVEENDQKINGVKEVYQYLLKEKGNIMQEPHVEKKLDNSDQKAVMKKKKKKRSVFFDKLLQAALSSAPPEIWEWLKTILEWIFGGGSFWGPRK